MNIFPIKNEKDYEETLKRIEILFKSEPNTPEGDELEILITLVSYYEDEHYKIDAPNPVAAIEYMMEAKGMSDKDMIKFLGSRSRVSEIMNRKRGLSLNMIRNLTTGLNIPARVLVQEYELTS